MNSTTKIIAGVVVASLAGVAYFSWSKPPIKEAARPAGLRAAKPARSQPAQIGLRQILAPIHGPASSHSPLPVSTIPINTGNDTLDLQSAANDIAGLLRAGDLKTFVERYVPAERQQFVLQNYQQIQAEPYGMGPQRMEMMAQVFDAVAGETPTLTSLGWAKYEDHTLYSADRYPPGTDLAKIPSYRLMPTPIYFTKGNGQWRVNLTTLGLLEDVVHNVPLDTPPTAY